MEIRDHTDLSHDYSVSVCGYGEGGRSGTPRKHSDGEHAGTESTARLGKRHGESRELCPSPLSECDPPGLRQNRTI